MEKSLALAKSFLMYCSVERILYMCGDIEGIIFWLKVWVEKYVLSWNIEFHCFCASVLHLMKYNSLGVLHITNWHISSAYEFEFDMCEENAVFYPSSEALMLSIIIIIIIYLSWS